MKKSNLKLTAVLVITMSLLMCSMVFADLPIKLSVNGKEIASDVPPQNINGRILVPVRFVAEALGAVVNWNDSNKTVLIKTQDTQPILDSSISTSQDEIKIIVNGKELTGDVSPQNIDGRIMIPVRIVAEALGADVKWDSPNNSVLISTQNTKPNTPINDDQKQQSYVNGNVRILINAEGIILDSVSLESDQGYKIFGEIKNTTNDKTYKNIRVTTTIYNNNGKAIGSSGNYVDSINLSPGKTTNFSTFNSVWNNNGASISYLEVVIAPED